MEMNWIVDREPPQEELVIVSIRDTSADRPYCYSTCGWKYNDVWIVNNEIHKDVVAWMPFPKPLIEL